MQGWRAWKVNASEKNPVMFWIAENGLTKMQNFFYFVSDVYNNIRCYFVNRYVDKLHYLQTKLVPGKYYDIDSRVLHGNFETLVDFVESELAHEWKIWHENGKKLKGREAGMAHLNWQCTLDAPELPPDQSNPAQANNAREVKYLYMWWKDVRPNRSDAYNSVTSKYNIDVDDRYAEEDKEMLHRFIEVHRSLWT